MILERLMYSRIAETISAMERHQTEALTITTLEGMRSQADSFYDTVTPKAHKISRID